jgi:mono/diheme cytochrome c family protein
MASDKAGIVSSMTFSMVVVCTLAISRQPLNAQDVQTYSPEQVRAGSAIYSRYCAICHGSHMEHPDEEIAAFDLRHFPHDQHDRFVNSVTSGKNAMPRWGELLKPADIEALWAYVCEGEK